MEDNKFELKFTKFFDVKSPIGISQRENADLEFQSIGIDIYMPKPTMTFINGIVESNKKYVLGEIHKNNEGIIEHFSINENDSIKVFYQDNKYIIYDRMQIPSGIGILIPNGYHIDFRSKSSNFKNDYTSVTGLIDCDYTFGMGIQLVPYNNKITLQVDEKVSQIVLIKSVEITRLDEISLEEWSKIGDVVARRLSRTGGFGSTNKFDK